ncbi:YdcF family protein [Corallococcus sp. H22C18031201]|uniref:YdcF family protein n=1 Tax=Citreicoccus inhibens TaxID=2849499 RepID=UPI000E7400B4|nr:YdcF family protein [Citreicoccus inhibens]MBU8898953.1 YdcF family protein [Citreicoccus inhibens]RJS18525.1 YdcF family protein [Corallococcus sp. H22C18031201]
MRPLSLRPKTGPVSRWLLALVGVLTCGVFGLAWWVDRFGQRERAEPADALVVLGARVLPGGVASGPLQARVEKAVALYRQGVAPRFVFSGGVGVNPPSEARVMALLAMRLGVPSEVITLEEESHSTEQNASHSAELLRALGARRVVVVSDPYHLLRARQYFRLAGLEVATSPALLTERNVALTDRVYWTVREAIALLLHPRVLWARAPEAPRD